MASSVEIPEIAGHSQRHREKYLRNAADFDPYFTGHSSLLEGEP